MTFTMTEQTFVRHGMAIAEASAFGSGKSVHSFQSTRFTVLKCIFVKNI